MEVHASGRSPEMSSQNCTKRGHAQGGCRTLTKGRDAVHPKLVYTSALVYIVVPLFMETTISGSPLRLCADAGQRLMLGQQGAGRTALCSS